MSLKQITLPLLALLTVLSSTTISAQEPVRPLLMPGKQSLFQRALVIPGSRIFSEPNAVEGADTVPSPPTTSMPAKPTVTATGFRWGLIATEKSPAG